VRAGDEVPEDKRDPVLLAEDRSLDVREQACRHSWAATASRGAGRYASTTITKLESR
jgi:hypothetical protein